MSTGRQIIEQNKAERAYKKSVQEMMDETMCRPGYRWLGEPLNKCVPAAVPGSYEPNPPSDPDTPAPPPEQPTPDEAIAAESAKRQQPVRGKKK